MLKSCCGIRSKVLVEGNRIDLERFDFTRYFILQDIKRYLVLFKNGDTQSNADSAYLIATLEFCGTLEILELWNIIIFNESILTMGETVCGVLNF